ncbi:MAG: hypothetical protein PVG78_08320 [Desulfobacterales bacterium]|jgi:hypothetical protein
MDSQLGILVNSDRHPEYILRLARAARDRGKSVLVHFSGAGIRLADGPFCSALSDLAELSADPNGGGVGRPPAVSGVGLSDFLRRCDRCVVF